MATITISRHFGSQGDTVAHILCARLGYRYFDKRLMEALAVQAGLPAGQIIDTYEQGRARSLVERLFSTFASPLVDPATSAAAAEVAAREQRSVDLVRQLILAAHAEGNVVILGRGGQAVLRGRPGVLHARLIAPKELRKRRHAERAGLGYEEASDSVERHDAASLEYVRRFYDLDRTDPLLYDLVINMDKVSPSLAADLIIKALECLPAKAEGRTP